MRKALLLLFTGLLLLPSGWGNRIEPDVLLSPERRAAREKLLASLRRAQEPLLDELEAIDLQGATVTLFALDPKSVRRDSRGNLQPQPPGVPAFHDWRVLGSREIADEKERSRLRDELVRGGRGADSIALGGFAPRQGLRIERGERLIDLILNFEGAQVEVFGATHGASFLTSLEPAAYYDDLTKRSGLHPGN